MSKSSGCQLRWDSNQGCSCPDTTCFTTAQGSSRRCQRAPGQSFLPTRGHLGKTAQGGGKRLAPLSAQLLLFCLTPAKAFRCSLGLSSPVVKWGLQWVSSERALNSTVETPRYMESSPNNPTWSAEVSRDKT